MTNYKYNIKYSSQFKKSFKKIAKQGKDVNIILDTIGKLASGEDLDGTYNNHKLRDDKYYKDCWECHLGSTRSDWLLIYHYTDDNLTLLMVDTGSHSELFNKQGEHPIYLCAFRHVQDTRIITNQEFIILHIVPSLRESGKNE